MSAYRVRATRPGEAVLLPEIEQSAGERFRTIPSLAWLAEGGNRPVERHRACIEAGLSWVAADDGDRPVAFLIADRLEDSLFVIELAVRLEAQGRGIGGALLDAVQAEARARFLAAVTLTTFRDVPWNAPYYARRGFRLLGEGDLTPGLRAVLDDEIAQGLQRDQRCAMRMSLADEG